MARRQSLNMVFRDYVQWFTVFSSSSGPKRTGHPASARPGAVAGMMGVTRAHSYRTVQGCEAHFPCCELPLKSSPMAHSTSAASGQLILYLGKRIQADPRPLILCSPSSSYDGIRFVSPACLRLQRRLRPKQHRELLPGFTASTPTARPTPPTTAIGRSVTSHGPMRMWPIVHGKWKHTVDGHTDLAARSDQARLIIADSAFEFKHSNVLPSLARTEFRS
jgi:hypothetical protein